MLHASLPLYISHIDYETGVSLTKEKSESEAANGDTVKEYMNELSFNAQNLCRKVRVALSHDGFANICTNTCYQLADLGIGFRIAGSVTTVIIFMYVYVYMYVMHQL